MIATSCWVPQGSNLQNPIKNQISEEDIEKYKQLTQQKLNLANQDLESYQKYKFFLQSSINVYSEMRENGENVEGMEIDEELKKYNLDTYDDEMNPEETNFQDTNLTIPDPNLENLSESETELENLQIRSTDSLLVIGRSDHEFYQLEAYVYEEEEQNLFIHHDFPLPSLPLCLEWLNHRPGTFNNNDGNASNPKGSFVAIGSFDTAIELWDLDYINPLEHTAILGQNIKPKSKPVNDEFHVDAVMGLSWNSNHTNLLASSSADTTVKLWDLNQLTCLRSFNHHTNKVPSVKWHPTQTTILMTGGFDSKVHCFDSRSPQNLLSWNTVSEIEALAWDPNDANRFMIATEDGIVNLCDIRQPNAPLLKIQAHDEACCSIAVHPTIPNLLVTGSADATVKVWDFNNLEPTMILSRNFEVGQVFTMNFHPNSPLKLSMAGSNGKPLIWDLNAMKPIRERFGPYYKFPQNIGDKMLVGINDDDSDDEDME